MYKIKNSAIGIVEGDITDLSVDAIVNPANSQLILGGGLAGQIKKKGGVIIQRECDVIGGIEAGQAVITGAGQLKARYVIHAVGPMMGEGKEDEKLHSAVLNCLKIAERKNFKSIAFPAISTGVFGYPVDSCARIMVATVADFLRNRDIKLNVVFCLLDFYAFDIFEREVTNLLG